MTADRKEKLINSFKERFGMNPDIISRGPGRVNLIGEHTDYNQGFVLPVAIDRDIAIVSKVRDDRIVRLYSLDFNIEVEFPLDNIVYDEDNKWSNYPKGVARILQEEGYNLRGMDGVITGNVPQGAGLSSSAAFEVAMAMNFEKLSGLEIDPVKMALLSQKAENKFVGVNCGIMDQFISRMGKKDHALLLDCRNLEFDLVPFVLEGIKLVVCNTNKTRGLMDSEYNDRRRECERGVKLLEEYLPGIESLRDVELKDFMKCKYHLPEVTEKRCRYVIKENDRVLESVEALEEDEDLIRFGELMNQSHIGLRDDYEVSCPELDAMVEIAWKTEGVIGSRMTGAGFGGCTVTIVTDDAFDVLVENVKNEYPKRTGLKPEIFVFSAEDGAGTIDI